MSLKDIINNPFSEWMAGSSSENSIIISSRIRLARNLTQFPFPNTFDKDHANQVIHAVRLALTNSQLRSYELTNLNELSANQMQILVEKHLISPNLIEKSDQAAIALDQDEVVSIMINEEDHIRIQCLLPGFQLEKAFQIANEVDNQLEKTLDFAFSEKIGYLTACPTNAGTGLRASVMLHLPGLIYSKQIQKVLTAVAKLGLTVRGLYGEGTEALGNIFQISNQVTLGQSEEEILSSLINVTNQILNQEKQAEKMLYQTKKEYLDDKIFRAYGILTNARIISSDEIMKLISDLRLGISLGILKNISQSQLNELMVVTRKPYLLNKDQKLDEFEQAVLRAKVCRERLKR